MGKRSRKRTGATTTDDAPSTSGTTRAERDAARARRAASATGDADTKAARGTGGTTRSSSATSPSRRRTPRGERPPAPWGNFPLVEICVLIAIVLLIAGFLTGDQRGATMVLAGLAVGSLAGLELSVREHFSGYRSHTTLLAGVVALGTATVVALVAGKILLPILFAVALIVFAACFYLFRNVFRRRSGGLSFR